MAISLKELRRDYRGQSHHGELFPATETRDGAKGGGALVIAAVENRFVTWTHGSALITGAVI